MKRVIVAALIGAALFLCAHRPATAMVESCPAVLSYQAVGQSYGSDVPTAWYGLELTALGPRTITSATLAFDTSAGWFTISVPAVAVTQSDRHYSGSSAAITHHDYVSQVMYARFASAITIRHAWVYNAAATGDSFGWQTQGVVQCEPRGAPSDEQQRHIPNNAHGIFAPDPNDGGLSALPSKTSLILVPNVSKALEENASCAQPFRDADVKKQAQPQFPDGMTGMMNGGRATSSAMIAVNGDGSIAGAWLWASSGYAPLDAATLAAAKTSTYAGARAYCRAVPGIYRLNATFAPN